MRNREIATAAAMGMVASFNVCATATETSTFIDSGLTNLYSSEFRPPITQLIHSDQSLRGSSGTVTPSTPTNSDFSGASVTVTLAGQLGLTEILSADAPPSG
jgi:hypothetical protein